MSEAKTMLHALLFAGLLGLVPQQARPKPFVIEVVDAQTGRGVPLVELETVNNIKLYTDSAGLAAFDEPGLWDQTVFFHVKSHGYEYPKDGFGYRGKTLRVVEGGRARLELKRINIAERLYRITGAGIYRDSVLAGRSVPLARPLLDGQVFGSDSVVNAPYRGRIYWFWGDTNRPGYPLGNFQVPGATSRLPSDGGLDPAMGVDLDYFLDPASGFAKPTARMPGEGPTWISGLTTAHDGSGDERLFAGYVKVRKVLEVYEHGLCVFNNGKQEFEKVVTFPEKAPAYPAGHPFHHTQGGTDYIYFANPFPLVRVRADGESLAALERYEAFTPLAAGARLDEPKIDRDAAGKVRYGWKANTPALGPQDQGKLINQGLLKEGEALTHLRDIQTGKPVAAHGGSVYWNAYRRRWVMIVLESFGTSLLGEIWCAEADTPLGPWVYARKIVTHDHYSFYNPKQHPFFDKEGGRVVFFEGTYTHTFSGNPVQTPRYDYNQIMYRLDLNDARLHLPVPVYVLSGAERPCRFGLADALGESSDAHPVAFFALDRPTPGAVGVWRESDDAGRLVADGPDASRPGNPLFFALRSEPKEPNAGVVALWEFAAADDGRRAYSIDPHWSKPGFQRAEKPVCWVWENPLKIILPYP